MADVDIEAVNKIRIAMGAKPLPVPGGGLSSGPVFKGSKGSGASSGEEPVSTLESRQEQGYDNWKQLQDEAKVKAKREARKEEIKKERERVQRDRKLVGKGLGEADEETELDTKTWLLQQKKRQRKIDQARKKLEQELAERDQQAEYTSADLAGVRVGHELAQFEEGGEQILTLKDAAVDASDEDDELENLDLRAQEKLKERLELKKKKPVYNPNDADEDGQKSILAQYDEEIDGKKRARFTLDGQGRTVEATSVTTEDDGHRSRSIKVSLDLLKDDTPISDYVDPSEIKIKKLKKSKKKSSRKRVDDDDDIFPVVDERPAADAQGDSAMEIDGLESSSTLKENPKKRSLADTSFVDDEDLQANLAMQRTAALKKRKRMRPEDLARQLREEASATPGVIESVEMPDEEPGLVIDETSEFVANLQKPTVPDRQRQRSAQPTSGVASVIAPKAESPDADGDGDVEMAQLYNDVKDEDERLERATRSVSAAAEITATGLEEEGTLDQGLGATLAMLKQRNLVKTADTGDLNALHRERQRFLATVHKKEEEAERLARQQREKDRKSGKLDRMSARDREEYARFTNAQRDAIMARQQAEMFNRDYKPNVQLEYHDEFGRALNQKEAFKHLSHQFHGKGSGKQKTEKRLKKIEEEKKREAMSALDASRDTNMGSAMGEQAKKKRQAGVRLQ